MVNKDEYYNYINYTYYGERITYIVTFKTLNRVYTIHV